jgi:hypothetical protein
LFAEDVLSRVPGGTILFDVKCSQRLAPAIEAAGGQALMFKTGHSLIKAKMKAIEAAGGQAPLGGEMSGHIFFKERWYGFDDGTYAGCRLLEIVSQSPDANAVLNALPSSFSTPELNVACAEGEPHQVTQALQALAANAFSAPARVSDIDGLRVDWPDGFGLIRASNTTPVLVLRFEGQTEAALHRIQTQMLALLQRLQPLLARADLDVVRLRLSGRGSWRAEVDNGATIELGRGTDDEVLARTERFVRTLAAATSRWRAPLEYADLRHRDGYALRLRGIGNTGTAAAAPKTP